MKTLIKTSLSVLTLTLLAGTARAEGVGIAETEITPDPSAMLEVASTNKGALFPRMSTSQRLAIATPAVGLLVYDTDVDGFFYRTTVDWEMVGSSSGGSPVGSVTAFAGTTGSIPAGWLLCDGTAVNSSNYPSLYTAIGTAWGNGSSDADPQTDFNLPDLRGTFMRGVSHGSGRDPNTSTRGSGSPEGGAGMAGQALGNAVGSVQASATARPRSSFGTSNPGNHKHTSQNAANKNGYPDGGIPSSGNSSYLYWRQGTIWSDTSQGGSHSHTITTGGDSETRPKNVYVNYIIKY